MSQLRNALNYSNSRFYVPVLAQILLRGKLSLSLVSKQLKNQNRKLVAITKTTGHCMMTTYRKNKVDFHNKSWEIKWNRRIIELIAYKDEHGDCNVPKNYPENKALGLWVATQRKQYRMKEQGQHSQLTEGRVMKLGSIDFTWKLREQSGQVWKKRCQALIQYRDKHGDCRVPQKYSQNKALGSWVNDQRKQYKYKKEGKRSTLTEARTKELESIGFVWKEREIECVPWHQQIRELIGYREKHGDCKIPFHYEQNRALAHWVANQRTQYKLRQEGKYSPMTEARIKELENIGFVWSCRDCPGNKSCTQRTGASEAGSNDASPATHSTTSQNPPPPPLHPCSQQEVGAVGKWLLELRVPRI
jgi:hypothetical protein